MAARPDVEDLYKRYVRPLPPEDRVRLLAVIANDLATSMPLYGGPERSLLELEGLGAELWQGVDAQAYVNELREEWDRRP